MEENTHKININESENFQNQLYPDTNDVYKNLLRICEEIDAALPKFQESAVNKNAIPAIASEPLALNMKRNEKRTFFNGYESHTEIVDTNLDNIEVDEEFLNNISETILNDMKPIMSCTENCNLSTITNLTQDTKSTNTPAFNIFCNNVYVKSVPEPCGHFISSSTAELNASKKELITENQNIIFEDHEIEQYMRMNNINENNFINNEGSSLSSVTHHHHQQPVDELEDPLQIWCKLTTTLNSTDIQKHRVARSTELFENHDQRVNATKNIAPFFNFTLSSATSSTSSRQIVSTRQNTEENTKIIGHSCSIPNLENEHSYSNKTAESFSLTPNNQTNVKPTDKRKLGLPMLVKPPHELNPKESIVNLPDENANNNLEARTLKILREDLFLSSSSSRESSVSPVQASILPQKKQDVETVEEHATNTPAEMNEKKNQPKRSDYPKTKIPKRAKVTSKNETNTKNRSALSSKVSSSSSETDETYSTVKNSRPTSKQKLNKSNVEDAKKSKIKKSESATIHEQIPKISDYRKFAPQRLDRFENDDAGKYSISETDTNVDNFSSTSKTVNRIRNERDCKNKVNKISASNNTNESSTRFPTTTDYPKSKSTPNRKRKMQESLTQTTNSKRICPSTLSSPLYDDKLSSATSSLSPTALIPSKTSECVKYQKKKKNEKVKVNKSWLNSSNINRCKNSKERIATPKRNY